MEQVALYYPHIHAQDDTWLKYSVMYWPKMVRLRPPDYPTSDSTLARSLRDDVRWLIDLAPPEWAAREVGEPFLRLLNSHAAALRSAFALDNRDLWHLDCWDENFSMRAVAQGTEQMLDDEFKYSISHGLDPRLGYVHISKFGWPVVDALIETGLAVKVSGRGGFWIGMHPKLASVYTCALTERIAAEDRLHPVTDQLLPHAALSGWSIDHLMQALLNKSAAADEPRYRSELSDAFVFLAFETVIPANIERTPIGKIIEIRSRFGPELDAFRSYVTEQAQKLATLKDIRDVPVFEEYLHTEVQNIISQQLTGLRERLQSVGLDSVKALANVKSITLPPLAAAAADIAGLPPAITTPAALALCILHAPVEWRMQRRAAIRESPVGYLFRIEETLNPPTLIERLRRSWAAT
ncbi:hypothetical protein IU500_19335 [Nocardia terpenica]|uniref:DUF6236 family protein n=1 Tax=Nocardia terpenica TaxID=455432 RepID=UPI0018930028|nr:DUF6236 family protein [Nocardia terpenica]MBF6062008.1 hypothetical protein [Nocardia terpenica]MBF6106192.1 hypothetical protein [Nocardia terpenica]MBF6110428.1 hypothetical protein [Nocardia terpenica]MBF6120735.1 hypothetical protein [Nocardia terpenica]MBF6151764.1 hypothetical protein [Nocardia terpenica]